MTHHKSLRGKAIRFLSSVCILLLVGCYRPAERATDETRVKIDSIEPAVGSRGTTVVISGTGFSNDPNDLVVNFGPTRGTVKNAGEKVVVAEVPKTITNGSYDVTVENTRLKATSAPKSFVVSDKPEVGETKRPAPPAGQPAGTGPPAASEATGTSAQGGLVTVPAGTTLVVRTLDALSTKTHRAGQQFELTLDEPLIVKGQVVAPKGSRVIGRVVSSKEPGRVKGRAQMSIRLVELVPTGGSARRISTNAFSSEGKGSKKKDALIIGGMAGVGTAIGAIAGGGKGAAIGAAAGGAGGVGTVLATKGQQLEIPPETQFRFRLLEPVSLPSRGAAKAQSREREM